MGLNFMKHILTFLITLLATAGLRAANPAFTAFKGTNQVVISSNVSSGNIIIGPATPISTTASNAAKSLMVWTNDAGLVRLAQYPSNVTLVPWAGQSSGPSMMNLALGSNSVPWFDNAFGDPKQNYSIIASRFTDGGDIGINNFWVSSATDFNGNVYGALVGFSQPDVAHFGTEVVGGGSIKRFRAGYDLIGKGGAFIELITAAGTVFFADDGGGLSLSSNVFSAGRIHSTFGMATNTASFGFITTNLLSGQTYTNFAQRGHVVASVGLTNVLAGDVSAMSLIVDQNGDGTWDTTNGPVRLNGVALLAGEQQLAGLLQPGARFSFTNQSAGVTPGSALIRPGSCQWSRW